MYTTEHYKQAKEKFLEKYRKEIVPALMPYEQERKKRSIISKICIWITWILGVLFFLSCFMDYSTLVVILVIAFSIFFLGSQIMMHYNAGFLRNMKYKITPVACSCFENLEWIEKPRIDADFFRKCCFIFNNYTYAMFDDVFFGSYKNTDYEIIETHYVKEHRTHKGSYHETLFDGVILKIKLNKKFNSHTVIKRNGLIHVSPSSNLKHTNLEDTVFEKKYDVFTNDEVEARYLITTSFMERLNNCATAFGAKVDRCVFYEGEIIIGLSTRKNLFEPINIHTPLTSCTQILSLFDEIYSVIDLINYFKLSEKTGL